jgi:hypothetical protein
LKIDPESMEAIRCRAQALFNNGNYEAAAEVRALQALFYTMHCDDRVDRMSRRSHTSAFSLTD